VDLLNEEVIRTGSESVRIEAKVVGLAGIVSAARIAVEELLDVAWNRHGVAGLRKEFDLK
jgi:hypothetical protein